MAWWNFLLGFVASAAAASGPAAQPPQDYTRLSQSQLLDFRFSFPTIAGTYPKLLAKLRAERDSARAEALVHARADAEARMGQDFPFHRHDLWRDWTVTGNAYPLLSLVAHTDTFTGGAHGNHGSSALLWDEDQDFAVELDRLFGGSTALWEQLKPSYCIKLDAERQRRQIGTGTRCPERKELTIVPIDSDFNFAFDSLRIIADPYVAGSYAEGAYVIALPINAAMLESIESAYRKSFEVQRQ
jgi:hypothetical protein